MSDLVEKIAKIDALLARNNNDNGYQAFVHMQRIWPQLRVMPEQLVIAKRELQRVSDKYGYQATADVLRTITDD